jgi:hypothetical protein
MLRPGRGMVPDTNLGRRGAGALRIGWFESSRLWDSLETCREMDPSWILLDRNLKCSRAPSQL